MELMHLVSQALPFKNKYLKYRKRCLNERKKKLAVDAVSYGLEKLFDEDLYKDFEQLTLDFYLKGNLYGLEKYWAFHHYRGQKEPIEKRPELEILLKEEYRSIADFRAIDHIHQPKGKQISSNNFVETKRHIIYLPLSK
ncbi:hypothetical protein Rs2_11695 [Raphanus sativus]|nr:hypothetical protein Rs2_11695 [Raphanus sativus]